MKRKRYSEEQIISILREHEAGLAVRDLVIFLPPSSLRIHPAALPG